VERIEGDFFSVMGLPLRLVLRLLEEAGEAYDFGGAGGQRGEGADEESVSNADEEQVPAL
jgi:hypothetical protein